MGNKTWIRRNELPGRWERATGERHTFQLKRRKAYVLEVRDLHFHHDSAVLLPEYDPESSTDEKKPFGFDALRTCYLHAKEHPERKILLAGHADTTGADAYNVTLSEKRADSVRHALLGNRDDWVKIAQEKHKVEDYQLILKWVDAIWGWGCDPGAIDNQKGPKTKKAVETFQKQYNAGFDAKIAEDGVVGKQTWEAIFDVYMEVLASSLDTDLPGLATHRKELRFFDSARQAVGCGENWPIEKPLLDEYKSRTNRRVEIVFIEPSNEPKLECHPSKGKCLWEKCELYDPKPFDLEVIPVKKKEGTEGPYKLMVAADERAKVAVLVRDGGGTVVRRLEEKKEGRRHGGTVVFDLDCAGLPTPTQLIVEQWGFEYPHGVAFDPERLREALAANDNVRATAVIYGEEDGEKKGGTKLFAWEPPAPKTATAAKHRLQVRIDTSDDIDLNSPLLKELTVTLDGKESETKKGALVGDFELTLPGKTEYVLKILIPDFEENLLGIADKVKFEFLDIGVKKSNTVWLLMGGLHPRLHGKSARGAQEGGATVWTLMLDVSFIDATVRTRQTNKWYQYLRQEIDDKGLGRTTVLADPRRANGAEGTHWPTTYLLLRSSDTVPTTPNVNLFLYFRHESDDPPFSDDHRFESRWILFPPDPPPQGAYGSSTSYNMYPNPGWAEQLRDSQADAILVLPNVVQLLDKKGQWIQGPVLASFGNLGASADSGVPRLRKLAFMLWANQAKLPEKQYTLGKLIVGGWSSGMNTAFQWFAQDNQNRVDAFFCFDAVAATSSLPGNGTQKVFPSPDAWNQWLKKKEGRKVAFLSGAYSEAAANLAAKSIPPDRMLLNAPGKLSYWYEDDDYIWAHLGKTFDPLPAQADQIQKDRVYFSEDPKASKARGVYRFYLHRNGVKSAVASLSIHEAAHFWYDELKFSDTPTDAEFLKGVATLNFFPGSSETDPSGRIRHVWSMSGVTRGVAGALQGHLWCALEKAVEKGLLPKL